MSWLPLRLLLSASFALLALPALGQTILQNDDAGNPMQGVLRYGSARILQLQGATSVLNPPLTVGTKAVDVVCTVACHIVQGASAASATTNDSLIPANIIVRLKVNVNDSIAIIRDGGTAGQAFVTELK